jgi:hypothetical protein
MILLRMISADVGTNTTGDQYQHDDDDDDGDNSVCRDDAGAEGVNQCPQFRENTPMLAASYRDVMLAESQGTDVTGVQFGNVAFGEAVLAKRTSSTVVSPV